MSFNRFVELGRVVLINYGPDEGKLATIVDVIDGNRALVDGPFTLTGVSRQQINFKRLSLTNLKVKIGLNAGHNALTKAWEKADIKAKWAATSWAQRLEKRKAKAATTDFDRFAALVAKKTKSKAIKKQVAVAKKTAKK